MAVVVEKRVTVGSAVSTTMLNEGEVDEVAPVVVVWVDTIDHVPSARVPRVQLVVDADATNVHETSDSPLFEAVTVTVLPDVAPPTVMVGVESYVVSSVEDDPVSDEEARSGEFGGPTSETAIDSVADATWFAASFTE